MASLNADIPSDLKARLEHACTDRRTSIKAAVRIALEGWLEPASKGGAPAAPAIEVSPQHAEILRRCAAVLTHGRVSVVKALTENVNVFYELGVPADRKARQRQTEGHS